MRRAAGPGASSLPQMEAVVLIPYVLGLLLLPLLAVVLCVRCRELPGEWGLGPPLPLTPSRLSRTLLARET